MSGQSPLKDKPLRLPGESVDKEIDRWIYDATIGPFFGAGCFCIVAFFEWYGYLTHSPRRPIVFSVLAMAALIYAGWRFFVVRRQVRRLRQGRDGERAVGQFLERLRADGAQVFHDIPGEGFNLDQVISTHGIYAVETKTWSKPWPDAKVVVEGDAMTVAGQALARNPIEQVSNAAFWLEKQLKDIDREAIFDSRRRGIPGVVCRARGAKGVMSGFWSLRCCPASLGKRRR